MANKKIITIFIIAVVLFSLSGALVFFLIKRTGNSNQIIANGSKADVINELKNHYPAINDEQASLYVNIAAAGGATSCQGRSDASVCASSIGYIKGKEDFCHDLDHADELLYRECVGGVLKKSAKARLSQCQALSGDDYYNCLWAILDAYTGLKDCGDLPDAETRSVCEDFFNYRTALISYDRALCGTVKTEKLNQYCLKVIIDKNQDTDKDGLTDLDEINIYRTHHLRADSDNDGVSDGEAVRRGLIKAK